MSELKGQMALFTVAGIEAHLYNQETCEDPTCRCVLEVCKHCGVHCTSSKECVENSQDDDEQW